VSQKWASRPSMLQTPNTRCSGRSFWQQPDFDKFRVIQGMIRKSGSCPNKTRSSR
jgi:hypothetical protein